MKIAIVGGTGKEGIGLARRWAKAGHHVRLGSRDGVKAKGAASRMVQDLQAHKSSSNLRFDVHGSNNAWAIDGAEVVVLAIPFAAHGSTLEQLRNDLSGKVLIDITVPLNPPKVSTVHLPDGQSAALRAQRLLGPEVAVVAALHHVSSTHLADLTHDIDCDVLACSDDQQALDKTLALIEDLGARGIDAGKLPNSIALESITPILIHLNKRYKCTGTGIRVTGLPTTTA